MKVTVVFIITGALGTVLEKDQGNRKNDGEVDPFNQQQGILSKVDTSSSAIVEKLIFSNEQKDDILIIKGF